MHNVCAFTAARRVFVVSLVYVKLSVIPNQFCWILHHLTYFDAALRLNVFMSGLLWRFCCILAFFVVIFCPSMSVYITSPDSIWALWPRGKPPPCSPELRSILVSFGLWNPTRFMTFVDVSGWPVVPRRGCRAGRRIQRQRVTSAPVSLSTSPSHHTTFARSQHRTPFSAPKKLKMLLLL